MTAKEGINRLTWRFTKGKAFQPNENDIHALNAIIAFYGRNRRAGILGYQKDKIMALRLYIHVRRALLRHYATDVMDPKALNRVLEVLNRPQEWQVEQMAQEMNDSGLYQKIEKDGKIEAEDLAPVWDYQTVAECINKEFNQVLESIEL